MSGKDDERGSGRRGGRWLATASAWQVGLAAGVVFAVLQPLVRVLRGADLAEVLPGGLTAALVFGVVVGLLFQLNRQFR